MEKKGEKRGWRKPKERETKEQRYNIGSEGDRWREGTEGER